MPQATIRGSQQFSDATPESPEERNAREIAAARLEWQTRQGNSLALTVRWRRFYQMHPHSRESLEKIARERTERIAILSALTTRPEPHTSGETWTRAMEKLEDADAELAAVRACLRDGGKR